MPNRLSIQHVAVPAAIDFKAFQTVLWYGLVDLLQDLVEGGTWAASEEF